MDEKILANAIDFSRMPTAASFQFLTDQVSRVRSSSKVAQTLGKQLDQLVAAIEAFDLELKRSAKNLATDKISEADKEMDQAYTALKVVVRTMHGYPPNTEFVDPLNRVWQKIKDYKIDIRQDLNVEMGLMVNLLHDLRTDPLKADVAGLGLAPWVTALNDRYEHVHTLMVQRTNEQATMDPRRLSQTRNEAEAAYRELLQVLNAHITLEGDEQYKDTVALLNAEVTHYNQTLIARRKGKTAKETTPVTEDKTQTGGESTGTEGQDDNQPGDNTIKDGQEIE